MKGRTTILILSILCLILLTSCATVKPYQRVYLDDAEMKFGADRSEKFELKAFSYREGGVNIVKTKSSGGCGCN